MKRHFLIGGIAALCFAISAQAQPYDPFKDWISTANYMRSQGVEPASIGWLNIEQQCLGLKTETDQHAYNACKYEKAMNDVVHNADRQQCFARARAAYPSYLATQQPIGTVYESAMNGVSRSFTHVAAPLPYGDVVAMRDGAFAACMQDLGWVSAYNANLGKRYSGGY